MEFSTSNSTYNLVELDVEIDIEDALSETGSDVSELGECVGPTVAAISAVTTRGLLDWDL